MNEKESNKNKIFVGSVSPNNRHSHIPVPSRTRTESGTNERTLSPRKINSKNCTAHKTSTEHPKRMIGATSNKFKSSSPLRPKSNTGSVLNDRSKSSNFRNIDSEKIKRIENNEQCRFTKIPSARKMSTESILNYTKSYTTITLSSPRAEESDFPTDNSPGPDSSTCSSPRAFGNTISNDSKDLCMTTTVSKTSLLCDFDLELCLNGEFSNCYDVTNSQIEFLDLRLKDSESEFFSTVPRSLLSSARQTCSTESKSSPRIMKTPQETIRTPSGDELVLSSSIELDDLENDFLPEENEETIRQLLNEADDDTLMKAFDIDQMVKEDSIEYYYNETNEIISSKIKHVTEEDNMEKSQGHKQEITKTSELKMDRKGPENELMDENYRKFMYHPTVLKRQMEEESQENKRQRSKSIENNLSFKLGDTEWEKSEINKSSFKKNLSQTIVSDRDVNITPLRTWTPQEDERQLIYSNLNLIQNSDYVLTEMKRERSKSERITGTLLRFTAKFIHLLAILNLWPGDNCQMLTFHSLQYGR